MKNTIFLIVLFLLTFMTVDASEIDFYEMPRTQVVSIQNDDSKGQYELYIKLPKDYTKSKDTKYPVIYITDAVWHLEALSAATEYMLEDVILVGVSWRKDLAEELKRQYGESASRFTDYSFWEKANPNHPQIKFGQAKNHLAFIRNDVIQYVDNNYRTDPDSRTYFGYSLSGAFGAYILLTQPGTFDNYILGSPLSKDLLPYLSEINTEFGAFGPNKNTKLNANVFIAYGTLEEEKDEPIEEFIDLLDNRANLGLSIQTKDIEGDHQTAFPMIAVQSVAWLSRLISDISYSNPELSTLKVPQLNKAFINTAPEDRKDGIPVGELGVDGGNEKMITELAQEIANHEQGRFSSFLIAQKDQLIFESYYGRGRMNQPHMQASATKAYTSLLLGRAIQLGYLTMDDLDKPLVSFLKDLEPEKFVDGAEKITLSKALTMRGGIDVDNEKWEDLKKNSDALKGQGQVQVLLENSAPITSVSQQFSYGNFNPDLVMQVIEAVVPGTAMDFLKNELFHKMGITNYVWETTVSGLAEAGARSKATSRDMVKFGILARNKGKWNSEQLIPEAFMVRAIEPILYTDDDYEVHYGGKNVSNQGYGYFWWNADLESGGKVYFSSSAQGGWGQFIVLIEELDLIIVFTGLDNDTNYLQIVAERILPAFVQ